MATKTKKKLWATASDFVQTRLTKNTVRFDVANDEFGDENITTIYINKRLFKEAGFFPENVSVEVIITEK